MTLTGRQRYVHFKPWFRRARLVLQVEEMFTATAWIDGSSHDCVRWRDATVQDCVRWRDATVQDLAELAAPFWATNL